MKWILLLFVISISISSNVFAQCGEHCGTGRWTVKTLSETTVGNVNFTPWRKTVHWLVNAAPPVGPKPEAERINGLEWRNFRIKAVLIGYKKEAADHDLHVVIADRSTGETMIVKLPILTVTAFVTRNTFRI